MKQLASSGRKFILTLVCIVLLSITYIGSGFWTSLQTGFSEFAMGLAGLLGIYCGGNVSNKLVTKNNTPNNNNLEGF